MTVKLTFAFKGDQYELLDIDPMTCTLQTAVNDLIALNPGITPLADMNVKLLYRGKDIAKNKNDALSTLGIAQDSKILVIATSQSSIEKLQQDEKKIIHQPFIRPKPPPAPVFKQRRLKSEHSFGSISVLQQFSDKDQAYNLLERLADDRGIVAIMEKHQWKVGLLKELSPEEKSILGYNRNNGMEIALRLRTDDYAGFRIYESIKQVLLHELCHNEFSEHDSNFHQLNRQLNKESIALDWTKTAGRMLDPNAAQTAPTISDTFNNDYVDQEYVTSGDNILGGHTLSENSDIDEIRRARATAAEKRLQNSMKK